MRTVSVTNSLSRTKEPLVPLEAGKIKLYVCGPTVYGYMHIGNARPLVFFDVVARYLRHIGYDVLHVMNYTDVDDKIINKAIEEKSTAEAVALKYVDAFEADIKSLGVKKPNEQPKVSTHIPEIISLIEKLIQEGAAYVADNGEVFFSVRHFASYGKLSGRKVDELLVGARIAPDEKKKDPLDFSLWKPQKAATEIAWNSPWGKGRPGWHIECSAMAMRYLGKSFDIHGGGLDLIHPHHENEIAQSEAANHAPYCKYWLHNNMLTVASEKMSKSIGNVWLIQDFVKKHSAEALKYFLLSAHYRSTLDFNDKQARECQGALHRIYTTLLKCQGIAGAPTGAPTNPSAEEGKLLAQAAGFKESWHEAMDNDFNTAKLLGDLFDYVRAMNAYIDRKGFKITVTSQQIASAFLAEVKELSGVLNLFGEDPAGYLKTLKLLSIAESGVQEADILRSIAERSTARQNKDFATADRIRKELFSKGIELRDKGTDTEWDVIF